MPRFSSPKTPKQWQDAVDAAQACIVLANARLYGLVIGGFEVRVSRCLEILAQGKAKGILPSADAIERFVTERLSNDALELVDEDAGGNVRGPSPLAPAVSELLRARPITREAVRDEI